MPKFDKKFVHFMWSNKLKGKKCFVSDYIDDLVEKVVNSKTEPCEKVTRSKNKSFPFQTSKNLYLFAYYDPYYGLKLACEQGKIIQVKNDFTGEWVDKNVDDIYWDFADQYEIRIKPEEPDESKPVTNRELARWLAQGNGEYYEYDCDGWESQRYIEYQYEQDNLPVSNVMVRKWEDEEWHEPTREYLGL